MLFILLMSITTTSVAGAAGFFSVYGLAHTFAASFWSVVFMGGALEAGKLMLASYLYRYNSTLNWATRMVGYSFVAVLMGITSLGIYGYLADAYQSGSTDMKQIGVSLELKKEEQATLQKRKTEIDAQIAQVATKDVRGKQRLMTQFGPEVNTINARLIALTSELQTEAQKQISTDSHVGPIVFVARVVGIAPDNAISLLILLIVSAFDPLAVYLTIATNNAIRLRSERIAEKKRQKAVEVAFVPPLVEVTEEPVEVLPEVAIVPEPPEKVVVPAEEVFVEVQPSLSETARLYKESVQLYIDSLDEAETQLHAVPEVISETQPSMSLEVVTAAISSAEDSEELEENEPPLQGPDVEPIRIQIKKIYEESAAKPEAEQTPVDKETVEMVQRFMDRQNLIKNVRNGTSI